MIDRMEHLWSRPAVTLRRRNSHVRTPHQHGIVDYHYNSHGYRTREFRDITTPYVLALGCSHTEGEALHRSWCDFLQDALGHTVINLGIRGSDAGMIRRNIQCWTASDLPPPRAVIVQWPDAGRLMIWEDTQAIITNSHSRNTIWQTMLRSSECNFDILWLDAVISANRMCQDRGLIIINMHFPHSIADDHQRIFDAYNVKMHINSLTSKHIWQFDNGALDGQHHSEQCHQQWARRLHKILLHNENTTR